MVNKEGKQETLEDRTKNTNVEVFVGIASMMLVPGGMGSYFSSCDQEDVKQLIELDEKGEKNWDEEESFRHGKIKVRNSSIGKRIVYTLAGAMDTAKLAGYAYIAKSIYDAVVN